MNSNNDFVKVYKTKKPKSKAKKNKVKTQENINELEKNSVIVNNQVTPYVRTNFEVSKSSSFYTTCQFCQKKIYTKTNQHFNSCTCFFCCCTGCLIYVIVHLIRRKRPLLL